MPVDFHGSSWFISSLIVGESGVVKLTRPGSGAWGMTVAGMMMKHDMLDSASLESIYCSSSSVLSEWEWYLCVKKIFLSVPDTSSHHPVRVTDPEQPEGVVVPVWLCVSGQTGDAAGLHGSLLHPHSAGRLLQRYAGSGERRGFAVFCGWFWPYGDFMNMRRSTPKLVESLICRSDDIL